MKTRRIGRLLGLALVPLAMVACTEEEEAPQTATVIIEADADLEEPLALIVSTIVMLSGLIGAWFLYVKRRDLPGKITGAFPLLYTTVKNKYFYDETIDATVIRGTMGLAHAQKWFDEKVIDGIVVGMGHLNALFGNLWAWFDKTFVDGLVNLTGNTLQFFGQGVRLLQGGRVRFYLSMSAAAIALVAAVFIYKRVF